MKSPNIYGDSHRCYCCGVKDLLHKPKVKGKKCRSLLEVHHLVPTYEGGNDEANNKIVLCSNCHSIAHLELIAFEKWYDLGYCMKMKWTDLRTGKEWFGPYKE